MVDPRGRRRARRAVERMLAGALRVRRCCPRGEDTRSCPGRGRRHRRPGARASPALRCRSCSAAAPLGDGGFDALGAGRHRRGAGCRRRARAPRRRHDAAGAGLRRSGGRPGRSRRQAPGCIDWLLALGRAASTATPDGALALGLRGRAFAAAASCTRDGDGTGRGRPGGADRGGPRTPSDHGAGGRVRGLDLARRGRPRRRRVCAAERAASASPYLAGPGRGARHRRRRRPLRAHHQPARRDRQRPRHGGAGRRGPARPRVRAVPPDRHRSRARPDAARHRGAARRGRRAGRRAGRALHAPMYPAASSRRATSWRAPSSPRSPGRAGASSSMPGRRWGRSFPSASRPWPRCAGAPASIRRVEPIPVAPGRALPHGRRRGGRRGRSTRAGLWACGEVASTGLHGANRLASNSLLEALVFARLGRRRHRRLRLASPPHREAGSPPPGTTVPARAVPVDGLARTLMDRSVGVVRDATGLREAVSALTPRRTELGTRRQGDRASASLLVAAAALARRESRGAHCRADHPSADSRNAFANRR